VNTKIKDISQSQQTFLHSLEKLQPILC